MQGIGAKTLESGIRYLALHYSADPEKNDDWSSKLSKSIPKREWDREYEMKEDVYDGQPVFADYSDVRHCPMRFRETGLPILPGSVYIGGWDNGLQPAFVLLQITRDKQVHAILEVTADENYVDPMQTFAPRVLSAVRQRIPGHWDTVYHIGDPSIWARTPGTGESAGQLARRMFNLNIHRASNVWEVRHSHVTRLLLERIDENIERFLIDAKYCPVLRAGFQGAYELEISGRGDLVGPGRILGMPLKNGYSHVHDAFQYASFAAIKFLDGKLNIVQEVTQGTIPGQATW